MTSVAALKNIEDQLSDLLDDPNFRGIDARFRRFNIFEAVGAVRAELRHSNFLAYLLSPSRPHGLGSEVLERVLRALILSIPHKQRPLGILKIIVGDLDSAVVERERDNIDILIEIKAINLVVVIENKVGSAVTEGQLTGYKRVVQQKYHGWHHLFVLLNPDGSRPDDPAYNDPDYFTFSYEDLVSLLDKYLQERRGALSSEVTLIVSNYIDALRRHIVEDNELREIARQLYSRHKEAFDFIFESRPQPDSLLEPLQALIEGSSAFELDQRGSRVVRFAPSDWSNKELKSCPLDRWTRSGRNLLFELRAHSSSERINISLILGPSEDAFRKHIYSEASKEHAIFIGLTKPMGLRTSTIYTRDLLSARAAENMDEAEKNEALEAEWRKFVDGDLLSLKTAINRYLVSYAPRSAPPNGEAA
jgi:hypothetical protein